MAVTETISPSSTTTTTSVVVVSEYEKTREQRIKENNERLSKLGIFHLSLQLKPKPLFKRTPKTPLKSHSLGPTQPQRRSFRLQNLPADPCIELKEKKPRRSRNIVKSLRSRDIVTSRSSRQIVKSRSSRQIVKSRRSKGILFKEGSKKKFYTEGSKLQRSVDIVKLRRSRDILKSRSRDIVKSRRSRDILFEEGLRGEFYTEEHEKLLGNTELQWTAEAENRIYDQVKGKSCHQCRQKTLGKRTQCSQCNSIGGQFCGGCLYTRYGEHIVEANQNPNWICPPCRGICNCSLCRRAKGWPATGAFYKNIRNLGYKSVAHYLIATKRAPPKVETGTDTQQCAKRSLLFDGMEVPDDNATPETGLNQAENESSPSGPVPAEQGVVRPRKMAKKENLDVGEESLTMEYVKEKSSTLDMESPNVSDTMTDSVAKRDVGRLRKMHKKENLEVGKESLSKKDVKDNSPVSDLTSPDIVTDSVAKTRAGRSRNMSNGLVADMKSPNISDCGADSIARRLRSRTRI